MKKSILLFFICSIELLSTVVGQAKTTEARPDIDKKRLTYVPGDVVLFDYLPHGEKETVTLPIACESFYKIKSWPSEREIKKIASWAGKHGYSAEVNHYIDISKGEQKIPLWERGQLPSYFISSINTRNDSWKYFPHHEYSKEFILAKVSDSSSNFVFLNAMSEFYGRTPVYYYKDKSGHFDVLRCRPEIGGYIYEFSGNGFRLPTFNDVIADAYNNGKLENIIFYQNQYQPFGLNGIERHDFKIVCSAE